MTISASWCPPGSLSPEPHDQAESLQRLVEARPDCILFYKEYGQASNGLGVEDMQVCFVHPRLVPPLVKYGNHRVALLGFTFGTTNLEVVASACLFLHRWPQ